MEQKRQLLENAQACVEAFVHQLRAFKRSTMTRERLYFKPVSGYFWQWEEEGGVIAIPNSSTIAYREFVLEVMSHMYAQGLPPFGSLLLSIIATNRNGNEALSDVYALIDQKLGTANSTREPLNSAIVFLKQLSQLPNRYKEGKMRITLLQTLFADCHNRYSADRSKELYDLYRLANVQADFYQPNPVFPMNLYYTDFRVFSLLAKRFPNHESIIQRITEIPGVEEELILTEPETADTGNRDFIEQLTDNNKTFHVGSLVKRLWSGLNIPHHNMLPSRQPMGGVSDLTNKGDFDRLLISEFANEDLVFLSRLANNEALYINREIPPQNNDLERIILIDVSLKNWGTPKILAHALMLAIAKHPKTDIHCSAFAVGDSYHPLSWETVDDVVKSLNVLEPCLHPAKGLEAFFKEYSERKNIEVFFISSQDTYRLSPLHKTISDHYKSFNYWIQTDDKGNIDLYKRQQNNKKHVQHMLLPLEELWKKPPPKAPAEEAEKRPGIYPLLFVEPLNPRRVLADANGTVFMITPDKALLRQPDKNSKGRGWELLLDRLPYTDGEVSIGLTTAGQHVLLLFNVQNRQLVMMNIETGHTKIAYFPEWRSSISRRFIFHDDRFIYIYGLNKGYPSKYWTFELRDEIVITAFDKAPEIMPDVKRMFEEVQGVSYSRSYNGGILKNVGDVFINQVNNLVFNIHELRLTDHKVIKLESTQFREQTISASQSKKNSFVFNDGSTIAINRSGMFVFASSDPSIGTFYIPSVLDVSLAAASNEDFTGNEYFRPFQMSQRRLSTGQFWKTYMEAFIGHIKHGA